MPSHSIILTNRGFKIFSSQISADFVSLFLLASVLFSFFATDFSILLPVVSVYAFSTIIYFYYRIKIGYLYAIGFYYQVTLFLLLIPIGLMNWTILIPTLVLFALIYIFHNPFKNFQFPLGLFLALFSVAIALILRKVYLFHFEFFPLVLEPHMKEYNLPGLYFLPEYSRTPYSPLIYSILETRGAYLLVLLSTIVLREGKFWYDLLFLAGAAALLYFSYFADPVFNSEKFANLLCIWYAIFNAPGNRSYFHFFGAISLSVGAILWFSLAYFGYSLAPVVLFLFFFIFQGFLGFFVVGKITQSFYFHKK